MQIIINHICNLSIRHAKNAANVIFILPVAFKITTRSYSVDIVIFG